MRRLFSQSHDFQNSALKISHTGVCRGKVTAAGMLQAAAGRPGSRSLPATRAERPRGSPPRGLPRGPPSEIHPRGPPASEIHPFHSPILTLRKYGRRSLLTHFNYAARLPQVLFSEHSRITVRSTVDFDGPVSPPAEKFFRCAGLKSGKIKCKTGLKLPEKRELK